MAYPYDVSDLAAINRLATYYNGLAYDASTNPGGFDNDGHRVNFIPCLQDVAVVAEAVSEAADYANTKALAAASSEANAAISAAKLQGTSTTSLSIGTGSKIFSTQSGKFFSAGQDLKAFSASDPTKYMVGTSTSYSGTALAMSVPTGGTGGAGTVSDWTIVVSGALGPTGATGLTGATGSTGATGKAAGYAYTWNSSILNANPGTGAVSANSATLSSATALYINETDADSNALAAVLATLDDSTSLNKTYVRLYNPAAPTNWWEFYITGTLTDNGAWDTFTITHISAGGTFTNGANLYMLVLRNGDKGDTGATGSTGATGPTGPVLANKWTYSATTTDSDPGSGIFRLSPTSPDSVATVTFIYFDNNNSDGVSVTGFLDSIDDSTNLSDRGRITLTDITNPAIILNYKVTGAVVDGTGYRKVPVSWISGTSFPTVAGLVAAAFAPTGNKGLDGSGAGDILGPGAIVSDDEIATWNGTSGTSLQGAAGIKISNLQPIDATLTALAGVTVAADQLIYATGTDAFSTTSFTAGGRAAAGLTGASDKIGYFTGASTAATTDFTTQARQLLDDTSFSAMRTTLGLAIGTDVQAQDPELSALAGLTSAADKVPYFTGSGTAAVADFTTIGRDLAASASMAAGRTAINAQQQDGTLDALAAVTVAANEVIYATGADTFSTASFTAAGRAMVAAADAAAQTALLSASSATVSGRVELATDAETQTGTDTTRAVTPANLTAKEATTAEYLANTADRILTTDQVNAAGALFALTDGATVNWDMASGFNASWTIAGNRTLANPTNPIVGRTGALVITTSGASRTITFGTSWEAAGGTFPVPSTTTATKDVLFYWIQSATSIVITGYIKAVA